MAPRLRRSRRAGPRPWYLQRRHTVPISRRRAWALCLGQWTRLLQPCSSDAVGDSTDAWPVPQPIKSSPAPSSPSKATGASESAIGSVGARSDWSPRRRHGSLGQALSRSPGRRTPRDSRRERALRAHRFARLASPGAQERYRAPHWCRDDRVPLTGTSGALGRSAGAASVRTGWIAEQPGTERAADGA